MANVHRKCGSFLTFDMQCTTQTAIDIDYVIVYNIIKNICKLSCVKQRKTGDIMEYYDIAKYRIRYVVPFEMDLDQCSFEQVCDRIDSYRDYPYSFLGTVNETATGGWVRSSLRKGEQDVYPYIIDEFSSDGKMDEETGIEKMGCFWQYRFSARHPFQIEFVDGKDYDHAESIVSISICDMGLYVFRSGIGLLWYELQADEQAFATSKELIRFQNLVKELNRGYNNHLWINGSFYHLAEEHQADKVPFMLGNWIAERLQFLNVSFWAYRKNSYASLLSDFYYKDVDKREWSEKRRAFYDMLPALCPDKALLFSYIVFRRDEGWSKNPESLRTAYYLTNGYKESYEMSADIETAVKNPFSNVYWMAAREGCGYFAWEGDNNQRFFEKNQYVKIMNDYFLLYIRAIYQSYSLMRYAVLVSKRLSNDYSLYVNVNDETERLSRQISDISTEINLFLVKSVVTSVSYVHHQNEFYEYLIERLRVNEDAESVTAGLAALQGLQHETLLKKEKEQKLTEQEEREREAQREKEADNMFQIGLGLMTFLAVISAVTDAYGIVSGLSDPQVTKGWFAVFIVLFCICMIILVASITIFIKSIFNLRKKDNHDITVD